MEIEDLMIEAINRIDQWEEREKIRYVLGSSEYFERIMKLREYLLSCEISLGFEEDFIDRWNYQSYKEKDIEKLKILKQEFVSLTYRLYDARWKIYRPSPNLETIKKLWLESYRITFLINHYLNEKIKNEKTRTGTKK